MEVIKLKETDSTNRVAKELASQGACEWTCVLADKQTGGRGRMGRNFFSPDGNLYMSIILRPTLHSESILLITTAAAVAVYDAIKLAIHEDTHLFLENSISILYTTLSMALGIIAVKTIEIIFSKIFNSFSQKHK